LNRKKNNLQNIFLLENEEEKVYLMNTLVRLLTKIPVVDIERLREGVRKVSPSFLYYQFNESLPVDSPPLTAVHTFPNGGAIQLLEQSLNSIKQEGIPRLSQECQVSLFVVSLIYLMKVLLSCCF
jgi:hypothetical protein